MSLSYWALRVGRPWNRGSIVVREKDYFLQDARTGPRADISAGSVGIKGTFSGAKKAGKVADH